MAINPELVHRKITLILEDLEKVCSLAALAPDGYLSDPRNEVLAERYLERIIGRAIDINYHLVTETLLLTPRDYWDSFNRLSEVGVMDSAAAHSFASLAGLRNRITHELPSAGHGIRRCPGVKPDRRAFLGRPQSSSLSIPRRHDRRRYTAAL